MIMVPRRNCLCFCLSLFSLLSFAAPSWGQIPVGCNVRRPMLMCNKKVPTKENFESDQVETVLLNRLTENSWLTIGDPDFVGGSIWKIEVRQSQIGRMDPGYFARISGPNKLRRLHFRSVSGNIMIDKNMLQGLEMSLNYLQVQSGPSVNVADLAEMKALADLELVNTKIIGTNEDFARIIPRLNSLEIKDCEIESLPWETVANWVSEKGTVNLKINENKWTCDCSIAVLKRLGKGVVQSELQNLKCARPANLADRSLSEISESELCPLTPAPPRPRDVDSKEDPISTGPSGGDQRASIGGDGSGIGSKQPGEKDRDKTDLTGSGGASGAGKSGSEVRTEVIIAGTVVGALVLLFIIFVVVYKCRLYPKKKTKEERTSRTHQNKRYVNVIEEPPLQKFPKDNGAPANGGGSAV